MNQRIAVLVLCLFNGVCPLVKYWSQNILFLLSSGLYQYIWTNYTFCTSLLRHQWRDVLHTYRFKSLRSSLLYSWLKLLDSDRRFYVSSFSLWSHMKHSCEISIPCTQTCHMSLLGISANILKHNKQYKFKLCQQTLLRQTQICCNFENMLMVESYGIFNVVLIVIFCPH